MTTDIVEAYPTLWHYTTVTGLEGMLRSREIWATNIRYLNDDEEMSGFFRRKFPVLLEEGVTIGVDEVIKTARGQ